MGLCNSKKINADASFLILKNGNMNQVTYIVSAVQVLLGEKFKCIFNVFEPYNSISLVNSNDIVKMLTTQILKNKSRSNHRFVIACFYNLLENIMYTSVYDKLNDSFYHSKSKTDSDEPILIEESLQYAINSLKILSMFSKEKKIYVK
jgi:hypothetical protein